MSKINEVCPYCNGKEFVLGRQGGYADVQIVENGKVNTRKRSAVEHVICIECGSIVRSYISDIKKIASN